MGSLLENGIGANFEWGTLYGLPSAGAFVVILDLPLAKYLFLERIRSVKDILDVRVV